jgi:RNA polymerase sigma-70 factor (ECF subfamily)
MMAGLAGMTKPNKPALDELVAEVDVLYRYALPRVRNHHTAEDLVQETLVTAVRKFDGFEGRAALGTWLTGILRHKILDHLRHLQRHPESPASELADSADSDPTAELFTENGAWRFEPNAGLEMLDTDPGKLAERAEIRAAVRHCLDRLPGNLRRVFVLREVEDCPTDEICAAAGVTRGSLAVFMHRARQLLRVCLQKNWLNR